MNHIFYSLINDVNMNYSTDNTRIIDRRKVPAPYELVNKYPINDQISKLVYGTRNEISQILHNKDCLLYTSPSPRDS